MKEVHVKFNELQTALRPGAYELFAICYMSTWLNTPQPPMETQTNCRGTNIGKIQLFKVWSIRYRGNIF